MNVIKPTLIFLHGLLGSKNDWQKLLQNLPHFRCVALDLPLHGRAQDISVADFAHASEYLHEQIKSAVQNQPFFLVGYSLGGRLALHYVLKYQPENLQGLILEGANFGLQSETECAARWQNDEKWAQRFESEPMENVLEDWYQQPVFAHLDKQQRQHLIALRRQNRGDKIAQMLRATSLAKQPNFRPHLADLACPLYYLCGEKDQKFRQMAQQTGIEPILIAHAGHNAHQENPAEFAHQLAQIVCNSTR